MAEPTHKTYELTTLADVFNVVNLDNVATLASDLKGLLFTIANAKMAVEVMGGKPEDLDIEPFIRWTDDNIQRGTMQLHDAETKEHVLDFVVTPKPDEATRD